MIGPKRLKVSRFDGGHLGDVIRLINIGLFNKSSQMIVPKRVKFSGFNRGHPGMVIMEFGKD